MRARDDMAAMFCKRVATHTRKARDELEDIRRQQLITGRISALLSSHVRALPAAGMLVRCGPKVEKPGLT